MSKSFIFRCMTTGAENDLMLWPGGVRTGMTTHISHIVNHSFRFETHTPSSLCQRIVCTNVTFRLIWLCFRVVDTIFLFFFGFFGGGFWSLLVFFAADWRSDSWKSTSVTYIARVNALKYEKAKKHIRIKCLIGCRLRGCVHRIKHRFQQPIITWKCKHWGLWADTVDTVKQHHGCELRAGHCCSYHSEIASKGPLSYGQFDSSCSPAAKHDIHHNS